MRKLVIMLIGLTLSVMLMLGSCAKPTPAPSPTAAPKPAPAPSPAPVPKPTPAPTAAPAPEKTKEPYGWPKAISIGAVTLKGTYYPCASGWAELAKKYYGITATPEVTGGSGANVSLLESGQIEIGFVSPDVAYEAFRGVGEYAGKKIPLRAMLRGHGMMFHLFTLVDSGIKTVQDMRGHSYMYYMKGSPANISFGDTLREFYKLDDVKVLTMTGTEHGVYAVRDRIADVSQSMSYGATSLIETCTTHRVHFISLSPEVQKYICNKLLWLEPMPIPKGTYKGQNEDVPTVGYNVTLYCMKDASPELIYMMVKVVLEHPDEFSKYHPRAKEWTVANALMSPVTAFHDGAIRYYKEKGIWTPKMQELQDKLLLEGK